MINKAIGASGVVSQQCKTVVDQYGQTILDLLLAEVKISLIWYRISLVNPRWNISVFCLCNSFAPFRLNQRRYAHKLVFAHSMAPVGSGKFPMSFYRQQFCTQIFPVTLIEWYCNMFSMGIESVVDKENTKSSSGLRGAGCSACEMAVVWIKSQLKQNMTRERIMNYINEVTRRGVRLSSSWKHSNEFVFVLVPKSTGMWGYAQSKRRVCSWLLTSLYYAYCFIHHWRQNLWSCSRRGTCLRIFFCLRVDHEPL